MFSLPERSLYNKRIPKNKFYEKLKANTRLKDLFVEQVDTVVWKHKLSKDTVNLEPTVDVQEIQVFEILLKQREISRDILESIDKAIPYPILHVLVFEGEAKLTIAYKQRNKKDEDRFVVQAWYESEWKSANDLGVNILNGLDLGSVYENLVRSLMPSVNGREEDLQSTVERQKEVERLEKECQRLQARIKNEKKFNRKVALNMELQNKEKVIQRLTTT